jgi:alpha-L-fucosidase 2
MSHRTKLSLDTSIAFRESPRAWEQGLPVAAGNVGAVLYGVHRNHRVMLSHKKHWLPMIQRDLPDYSAHRAEMIRLCEAKQYEEADAYWMHCRETEGLDGFCWHDSNHPAAELHIEGDLGVAFHTKHILDCARGEGRIEWASASHDSTGGELSALAIQGLNVPEVIVMRWTATGDSGVRGRISLNALPVGKARGMGGERLDAYVSVAAGYDGVDQIVTGTYCTGERYQTRARVYVDGVAIESTGEDWCLTEGAEATVLITISDPELGTPEAQDLGAKLTATWNDLSVLLEAETRRFSEVYNRSSIELGATAESRASLTDSLLERVRLDRDDLDNALCEKMFSVGRYLIWSASQPGAFPSHLQGAWNGWYDAPWQCGYTQDENVQIHYWQVFGGNMQEASQAYFDYMERQLPSWRENAQKIHGLPGVVATINASRHGLQFHGGRNWPWDWYTGAAGWLAQFYWDHYLYTGDTDFLREKTLPLLKEIVTFYEAYAGRDEAGAWSCVPSISPENTPKGRKHKLCNTTTMDVSIAKEVYTNLIQTCELLDVDEADLLTWKATLESLPAYKLNADGAVKEWMDDDLLDNYRHRHQSHIYPVFPGHEVNPDMNAELLPAFATAVEKRLIVGMQDQVGWSLSHMVGIFARLGDGERAYDCLKELANGFLERNLFSYCQPGQIAMNLDGILGGSAGIQEMLLQSYPFGSSFVVRALPALPKAWPDGSFRGLRVRGGGEVSVTWQDSSVTRLELKNGGRAQTYHFDFNGARVTADLAAGETWAFESMPL